MTNFKTMAVESVGSGAPVVLVHGLGACANVWAGQLGALSRHHHVVVPDMPGSGRSTYAGKLSTASMVEDLRAVIEAHTDGPIHLVGHSYGSIICQHYAAQFADNLRSLALVGAFGEPAEPVRQALRDRAAAARQNGLIAIADATVQNGTSAETRAHRPEVAGFVRELVMRQDAEAYAATCEAIANTRAADLSDLRVPTLVITGDEDGTAPPAAAAALARAVNGSRFEILARCGHWTPLERPFELSAALANLLFSVSV